MEEVDGWRRLRPGLRATLTGRRAIRRIQVYGERCSGTHAIIKLIERNFGAEAYTEAFGFKHWFVPPQVLFTDDVLVLTIARAAPEWLRSLHRQPWHTPPEIARLSFADFIRTPWASYWDDAFWGVDANHPVHGTEMLHERDPATGKRFANPVALRTAKLRHWSGLTARAHNVALLSYDALRDDPAGVVAALSRATRLGGGAFVPLEGYKGHADRPYVRKEYAPLDADDADHAARWSDAAVEALFDAR